MTNLFIMVLSPTHLSGPMQDDLCIRLDTIQGMNEVEQPNWQVDHRVYL